MRIGKPLALVVIVATMVLASSDTLLETIALIAVAKAVRAAVVGLVAWLAAKEMTILA